VATRLVAFDVETTGLFPESDRLTEIAGVAFTPEGQVTGRFEELCNPGIPIPPEVQEITGITDGMVTHAAPPLRAVEHFMSFCDGATLVAHNALFDGSFLANQLERSHRAIPPLRLIDTLNWARVALKLKDFALSKVARYFHVRPRGIHRAAEDARIVQAVYLGLADRARTKPSPEVAVASASFPLADCLSSAVRLPPELDSLPELIEEGLRISIVYLGGTQGELPRPVTPRGLVRMGQASYLLAYCHREKKEKQFRLDRIRGVRTSKARARAK
jgi:DNA polymerase III epsilon subunit family exonuclease